MSGFLLDTNVISELTRPAPNANVVAFLEEEQDLWVSTVTMHELAFGIALLPEGRRRSAIAETLAAFAAAYDDRIIFLGREEARWAALLRAEAHGLAMVTRNVSDFEGAGWATVPWID